MGHGLMGCNRRRMHSVPVPFIQERPMPLHLVRPTPHARRTHRTPRSERPSLAVAFARSLALVLFIALTVLAQMARG